MKSTVLRRRKRTLRSCQRKRKKAKILRQMMMRMAFLIGRINTPARMTIKNNES